MLILSKSNLLVKKSISKRGHEGRVQDSVVNHDSVTKYSYDFIVVFKPGNIIVCDFFVLAPLQVVCRYALISVLMEFYSHPSGPFY